MLETATGIAFLMSSLYGAGHANAQTAAVAAAMDPIQASTTATTTEIRPLTESKDIEAYVREVTAQDPILAEVARCESTFRQYGKDGKVIRGIANPQDVGVMQINERYHAERALKLGYDIYTVEGNVAYGKFLYSKYGTDPWSASLPCWSRADIARK